MDKNRRTAIIILSVFSVLIITAWFLNFRQSLKYPLTFKGEIVSTSKSNNTCINGDCSGNSLTSDNLDLKLIDTDGDGISDWDELFIYGTSPYLEDTDGDGLTDYEEIFVYKTNPICPEGQVCSGALVQSEAQSISSNNSEDLLSMLENWDDYYDSDLSSEQLPSDLQPDKVDANYIRQLLTDEGFSKEDLDQISDAELIEVYKEVLADF